MSKSKKAIIAIAAFAIIPMLAACGQSPLGPEVPQWQELEVEVELEQPTQRKGAGHHRDVLY